MDEPTGAPRGAGFPHRGRVPFLRAWMPLGNFLRGLGIYHPMGRGSA
jgi:hypothetical protein